jgi:hypothetical protein
MFGGAAARVRSEGAAGGARRGARAQALWPSLAGWPARGAPPRGRYGPRGPVTPPAGAAGGIAATIGPGALEPSFRVGALFMVASTVQDEIGAEHGVHILRHTFAGRLVLGDLPLDDGEALGSDALGLRLRPCAAHRTERVRLAGRRERGAQGRQVAAGDARVGHPIDEAEHHVALLREEPRGDVCGDARDRAGAAHGIDDRGQREGAGGDVTHAAGEVVAQLHEGMAAQLADAQLLDDAEAADRRLLDLERRLPEEHDREIDVLAPEVAAGQRARVL